MQSTDRHVEPPIDGSGGNASEVTRETSAIAFSSFAARSFKLSALLRKLIAASSLKSEVPVASSTVPRARLNPETKDIVA